MYSLIGLDDEEITKFKGGNNKMRRKEFVNVLFTKKVLIQNMKRIQSELRRIGTYNVCKVSISFFDDKK